MFNAGVPGNAFAQLHQGYNMPANFDWRRMFRLPNYGGNNEQFMNVANQPSASQPATSGFDWKKMLGLSSFGAGIGALFGGSGNTGQYYDTAMQKYGGKMEDALRLLREHEAQGRGDITQYLKEAQAFGQPYREAGAKSLSAFMGSLGLGGPEARQSALQSFHEGPGYRYALNEALKQTQRGTAGAGLRGSGAEQRALMKQAQGMAEQQYGGWQNQLAGLSGMGQQAAEQAAGRQFGAGQSLANLGFGYGGRLSDLYSQWAQAQAEAEMAKGQAQAQSKQDWWSGLGSAVGGIASFLPFL